MVDIEEEQFGSMEEMYKKYPKKEPDTKERLRRIEAYKTQEFKEKMIREGKLEDD